MQPPEARDALNADDAGAVAFDARAAGDEEAGKIDDFGLAGGVLKDGFSIGQCGCHEQVFRTADGGKVEMDVRAVELAAAAENIPVLKIEPRPHLFEGLTGADPQGGPRWRSRRAWLRGLRRAGPAAGRARAPRRAWF